MRPISLIIITDPGSDPDDVKALLIAAILHRQGHLVLRAVVANGGGSARNRAQLARCILNHVGASTVPVGIGTDGTATVAHPHEYALDEYDSAPVASLRDGFGLLVEVLERSADGSVSVVCISSMRDFADVCAARPELVRAKVMAVAIQGGLVRSAASPAGWVPDTSQNNEFDRDGAAAVYAFCFAHGVPMTVTSRHAVPTIPMQLARSFAERTNCPVMRYLADAQFLGLEGLWARLCAGALPARCTKQWYFETFCHIDADLFEEHGLDGLQAGDDIIPFLDGVVKPYDVLALMTVLPQARGLFPASARYVHKGVHHLLLLEAAHAIPSEKVVTVLREVYHEVALNTASRRREGGVDGAGEFRSSGRVREEMRTNLHDLLRTLREEDAGEGSQGRRLVEARAVTKRSPDEAADFFAAVLALAVAQRARLDSAARLLGFTCVLAGCCVVLARVRAFDAREATLDCGAIHVAPELGAALTLSNAGYGLVCASVALRAGTNVARREAVVGGVAAAIVCVTFWALMHNAVGAGARALVADMAALASPATSGVGEACRAGARVSCALSFALACGVIPHWNLTRALAALEWARARRAGLVPPWLSGAALVGAIWTTIAATSLWLALLPLWLWGFGAAPRSLAERALVGVCCALNCAGVLVGASARARRALERSAARTVGVRSDVASVAPLLGYGSTGLPDPELLVAEAARRFCTVTLGSQVRVLLRASTTEAAIAARSADAGAEAGQAADAQRLASLALAARSARATGARPVAFDPASRMRQSPRGAPFASFATRADAFVVSAPADGDGALGSLCAWAERFEANEGRPPTVWMRELCADASLPSTLCHMTRCDKLLLLASPRTPHSLHAVVLCYVWRVLGGAVESVEVALDCAAPAEQTVAAFDAFHVMHVDDDETSYDFNEVHDTAEVAEQLSLCVQLANPQALNTAVRDLLPVVHAATRLGTAGVPRPASLMRISPSASSAGFSRCASAARMSPSASGVGIAQSASAEPGAGRVPAARAMPMM